MKLTDEEKDAVIRSCKNGATIPQIARRFDVSESTIDRLLRARRAEGDAITLKRGRPPKTKWRPKIAKPSFDIRPVGIEVVRDLCEQHHAYVSSGAYFVYAFAVFEKDRAVAVFAWSTPRAPHSICPEAPIGVLSLSRMVAVPREERALRHLSKPLRYQMKSLIDRTRWPVLVTYSDEGQGHTGNVYKCSGWQPTKRTKRSFYLDDHGRRRSSATKQTPNIHYGGETVLQRWEHRICPPGETAEWLAHHGWRRAEAAASSKTSKWIRS